MLIEITQRKPTHHVEGATKAKIETSLLMLFFCFLPRLYNKMLLLLRASYDAWTWQAKINKDAILGKVVGAVTGKKEGENVVDITTTIDLLPVFWEAEKVREEIDRCFFCKEAVVSQCHRSSVTYYRRCV